MLKNFMDESKLCVTLCCLCLCIGTAFAQKTKKKTVTNSCSFVEKEAINDKDFWFPPKPSMNQICIVNNAESATMIAYIYVANLYGKKIAKMEQPYYVSAVNDSLWMVSGTSKPRNKHKQWKGNFYLLIDKKSGKIVSFMHEK